MSNKTYKVYQAKYLIPKSDKGPAFTLLADPVKYHNELYNNGVKTIIGPVFLSLIHI